MSNLATDPGDHGDQVAGTALQPTLRMRRVGRTFGTGVQRVDALGLLLMVATRDRWPTVSLLGLHDGGVVVPWETLGLLLVAVPMVLSVATAALVRSSRTQPRRRIA